jgi:hypothetical protein
LRSAVGVLLVVAGLAVIGGAVAGIAITATEEDAGTGVLWSDDAARMDASGPAGGMIIGGLLAVVVGVGTASKYSGDNTWFLP